MVTLTKSTINVNAFKTVYDLINDNKPTGWTVLSSYPEAKPVFPCIVVNPARVTVDAPTFRSSVRKYNLTIELGFYAKASSRKEAVDGAIDVVREVIFDNESTLNTAKLALVEDFPFDEGTIDSIEINREKLNNGNVMLKLRVLL